MLLRRYLDLPRLSNETPILPRVPHALGHHFILQAGRLLLQASFMNSRRKSFPNWDLRPCWGSSNRTPWQLPPRSRPNIRPGCSGVPRKRGMAVADHLIRMPSVFRIMEPDLALFFPQADDGWSEGHLSSSGPGVWSCSSLDHRAERRREFIDESMHLKLQLRFAGEIKRARSG